MSLGQVKPCVEDVASVLDLLQCLERTNNSEGQCAAPRAYLCHEMTKHYEVATSDFGWGCGYRNCQMLLSSLQALGHPVFGEGCSNPDVPLFDAIPDIYKLQQVLQDAWLAGFDPQGAEFFGHRILGSKEWIGTTEIYCLLSYMGIKCYIVDFYKPSGPNGSHPALFNWVESYFVGDNDSEVVYGSGEVRRIMLTRKLPLYLQNQGHSRTIVGIEYRRPDVRGDGSSSSNASMSFDLLVFDPNISVLEGSLKLITSKYRPSQSPSDETKYDGSGDGDNSSTSSDSRPRCCHSRVEVQRGSWIMDNNNTKQRERRRDEARLNRLLNSCVRLDFKFLSQYSQYQILWVDVSSKATDHDKHIVSTRFP